MFTKTARSTGVLVGANTPTTWNVSLWTRPPSLEPWTAWNFSPTFKPARSAAIAPTTASNRFAFLKFSPSANSYDWLPRYFSSVNISGTVPTTRNPW